MQNQISLLHAAWSALTHKAACPSPPLLWPMQVLGVLPVHYPLARCSVWLAQHTQGAGTWRTRAASMHAWPSCCPWVLTTSRHAALRQDICGVQSFSGSGSTLPQGGNPTPRLTCPHPCSSCPHWALGVAGLAALFKGTASSLPTAALLLPHPWLKDMA